MIPSIPNAFILVSTLLATLLVQHVASQIPTKPTFFNTECDIDDIGGYAPNNSYHRNLNLVLSDLISHASSTIFYNSSAGLDLDTAYGQYYCRADLSLELCSDCVKSAAKSVSLGGACFGVKAGLVWYQECTLHYKNESTVGVWDGSLLPDWSHSDSNVSDPSTFEVVLSGLINKLIKTAAYGDREFSTGDENVTKYETVYCLMQCSPDISGLLCENCLRAGLRYLVKTYFGHDPEEVELYYPNCQLRYSLAPFYLVSDLAQSPTLSNAPPPETLGKTPAVDAKVSGKDAKYYVTRILVPVVVGSVLILCAASFGMWFYMNTRLKKNATNSSYIQDQTSREDSDIGLVECFSFGAIEEATKKFSDENKLGEGGFGCVYKGILPNGQPIAIKRLSKYSGQGIKEFKTEVAVVGKLQHRNLVRLLGFCIEHEERILVYEYLSNLSLDKFLFDAKISAKLDWKTRSKVIEGVAWGLRYLHIDSLLTIVHRDLKPSNILLDGDMNPKIADFGMAKLVRIDQTTGNTSRIAGTYGYMAPEYAMIGRFSTKSDIYSFGVIILEILSGKSNSSSHDPDNGHGLLHDAWRIWNEKTIEKLIDQTLELNYSRSEVERCLHIGLLCVQGDAAKRPTIRAVVSMLENPFLELPSPSVPSSLFHSTQTTAIGTQSDFTQTRSSTTSS